MAASYMSKNCSISCTFCVRDSPSVCVCRTCDHYLCESCQSSHRLMICFHGHKMVPILGDENNDNDDDANRLLNGICKGINKRNGLLESQEKPSEHEQLQVSVHQNGAVVNQNGFTRNGVVPQGINKRNGLLQQQEVGSRGKPSEQEQVPFSLLQNGAVVNQNGFTQNGVVPQNGVVANGATSRLVNGRRRQPRWAMDSLVNRVDQFFYERDLEQQRPSMDQRPVVVESLPPPPPPTPNDPTTFTRNNNSPSPPILSSSVNGLASSLFYRHQHSSSRDLVPSSSEVFLSRGPATVPLVVVEDAPRPVSSGSGGSSSPTSSISTAGSSSVHHHQQQHVNFVTVFKTFGQKGVGQSQFSSPHGFCLGFDGDIVVADSSNHRIQIFDKLGNFRCQFGSSGRHDGFLWHPRKVAVLPLRRKYVVCDRGYGRSRMQLFTEDGKFVKKFYIQYIKIVAGMTVTQDEDVVLVDSVTPTVFILNSNDFLRTIDCSRFMEEPSDVVASGAMPTCPTVAMEAMLGLSPLHLCVKKEAAVCASGLFRTEKLKSGYELYICDFKAHNICVVDLDGNLLRKIGHQRITNFPNGIDISPRTGNIVIGDSHGNYFHISVYSKEGSLIAEFKCPFLKVSRCCGLQISPEGLLVTVDKNYHHVIILSGPAMNKIL